MLALHGIWPRSCKVRQERDAVRWYEPDGEVFVGGRKYPGAQIDPDGFERVALIPAASLE